MFQYKGLVLTPVISIDEIMHVKKLEFSNLNSRSDYHVLGLDTSRDCMYLIKKQHSDLYIDTEAGVRYIHVLEKGTKIVGQQDADNCEEVVVDPGCYIVSIKS